MHFFYLDESGCSGADLDGAQEPIFVLGGVSVRDKSWVKTSSDFQSIIEKYFSSHPLPEDFELHAHELLSPKGNGPFEGHSRDKRNTLSLIHI